VADDARIIESYDAVLSLTRGMLDAARMSRWEELVDLEKQRSLMINAISLMDPGNSLHSSLHDHKRELIGAVMRLDVEIRMLTQDWMRELRTIVTSVGAQQRLQSTYGGNGLGN
jgi:hypothetical protein